PKDRSGPRVTRMLETQETSRSRVFAPALLAVVLIAAARADASTLAVFGHARSGPQTLRQLTSFARAVQRLVEVASERDRVDGSGVGTVQADVAPALMVFARAWQDRPDHWVRDEMLALPPPC
ncbi:hypothetical protein JYU07_00560, partial [Roseiflexus sp. AH-315-K22]|nr:hypothetical protein [Roseiflexus sp. AH-315-K22]